VSETIVPLATDIGPEAAVPYPILLQSETSAFLLFGAVRESQTGFESVGTAIVEIVRCSLTKFGYPNDEAWYSIPRTRGLSYGLFEVQQSNWIADVVALNRHAFPDREIGPERHFLALFHDSSFECLASDLSISLSNEPLEAIVARLAARTISQ
jgi:hypothetical protein